SNTYTNIPSKRGAVNRGATAPGSQGRTRARRGWLLPTACERGAVMATTPAGQRQPDAGHGMAVDPAGPAVQPTAARAGQVNLDEALPEIKALAIRVGGMKSLAQIIAELEQAQL